MLTAHELAKRLDGREYRHEITPEEEREAAAAHLVVIFGASDDLNELRGAIEDEVSAWNGAEILLDADGLPENNCDSDCPNFRHDAFAKIRSKGPPWKFKTCLPHATFQVMEDGHVYGDGIVVCLDDVARALKKPGDVDAEEGRRLALDLVAKLGDPPEIGMTHARDALAEWARRGAR